MAVRPIIPPTIPFENKIPIKVIFWTTDFLVSQEIQKDLCRMFLHQYTNLLSSEKIRDFLYPRITDFGVRVLPNQRYDQKFLSIFMKEMRQTRQTVLNIFSLGTLDFCISPSGWVESIVTLMKIATLLSQTPHFLQILGTYPLPRKQAETFDKNFTAKINIFIEEFVAELQENGQAFSKVTYFSIHQQFRQTQLDLTYDFGNSDNIHDLKFTHWAYSFFTKRILWEALLFVQTFFTNIYERQGVSVMRSFGPLKVDLHRAWKVAQYRLEKEGYLILSNPPVPSPPRPKKVEPLEPLSPKTTIIPDTLDTMTTSRLSLRDIYRQQVLLQNGMDNGKISL